MALNGSSRATPRAEEKVLQSLAAARTSAYRVRIQHWYLLKYTAGARPRSSVSAS